MISYHSVSVAARCEPQEIGSERAQARYKLGDAHGQP